MEPGLEDSLGVPGLTLHCQGRVGNCSGLDLGVLKIECRPSEVPAIYGEW